MINKAIDKKIDLWINENKNYLIEKWIELSRIPSIKGEPSEKAPFGINCAKALDFSAELFSDNGFKSTVYNNDGYALVNYGRGGKSIGLFCHSDVVPVGDGWLYTTPFEPIVKDGALIGRGVEDNKSGIIASLSALKFFKDNDIKLNNNLTVFIGSNEESGMVDIKNYINNHKIPDISIVPDADFPCSVGEKGIYRFIAESDKSFEDVIEFSGGEAFNIVLDRIAVKIRFNAELYCEIEEKIKFDERFSISYDDKAITLIVKGVAKHASIPEGSVNAAVLVSELLSGCTALNKNDRNIFSSIKNIIGSYYGEGIGVVHEDANFGKMTSVNGICKISDRKPQLSFDVRYGSTLDGDYLERESEKALNENGFIVKNKVNTEGFAIDKNSIFPEIFERIYEDVTGERKNRVYMSGGTYARKLKNAFSIGTFAFAKNRKSPVFAMPEGHGGAHQCDEMIDIEAFFTAVKILIHCVLACDNNI